MKKNNLGFYDKYIDPSNLIANQETEGEKWANSFMAQVAYGNFGSEDIDEGLMIAWFANAIVVAQDKIHNKTAREYPHKPQ